MLTAIDLFSGAGGFTSGLTRAGFHVIGALDSWDIAVHTYRLNFGHPIVEADINTLSVETFWHKLRLNPVQVGLLAGGPPCQGFSVQRIGTDDDERNNLIFEFARFVIGLRPQMFIMENVPGLLGKRGRHLSFHFEHMLRDKGYDVKVARVNAAEYGVPQIRKRIFYYGWLNGSLAPFNLPEPTHTPAKFRTVWDAIGDLPSPPIDYTPLPGDALHRRTRLSAKNLERLRLIPPGGGFESLPVELRVNCHKNGAARIGHRYVYGRLAPDKPSGTITARFDSFTRGKFAHPYEDRNITLREGARLQAFDDDYRFYGTQEEIAAQIGNAVPPILAEIIGRAVMQHLRGKQISSKAAILYSSQQLSLFNPITEA